jgi:alpha-mannosidase
MDFQKTRIRLVHLIDGLLDILDNDPEFVSFMMDGQTLPLLDYLHVKPYNREKLTKYILEGRIVIGPWYILPDEILITGESHIRNYLLGTRVAREFGADKMQIGYLPDSFGHPSQMPQILDKLGMDTIMFWRGATQEIDKTEFFWRAPDGTRIFTILMPDGYCTGAELSENLEITAARLDQFIENFHRYATTDKIYLSNGGDHLEPSPYLSKVIREANPLMKNGRVVHTTLPRFARELKRSVGEDLKEVTGELCGSSRSILLFSTLSTRTYLKQENHFVSRMLENELEPMYALFKLSGMEYPRDILVTAWKYLMENLPHDSICGCSVDQIHRDMMLRYQQVREIGGTLNEMARDLAAVIDTTSIGEGVALAVFNTTGSARGDYMEATVDFDPRPTSILDFNRTDKNGRFPHRLVDNDPGALREPPVGVRAFDGENEIPCALLDAKVSNYMELGYRHFPHQYNVNRCRIGFVAGDIPALGYKTLKLVPVYGEKKEAALPGTTRLENEFFAVEPDLVSGGITVTDKKTGRALKGLNRLADGGDCGDEYTYCPPDEDEIVYADPATLSARMTEANVTRQSFEITGVMRLPADAFERSKGRSPERVDCAFTTTVSLYPGVRRVDIRTTVDNHAKNHRLRALFPAGVLAQEHWSAGTFSVDCRKMKPDIDPHWRELSFTHPEKDFCDVNDGKNGLTVANRGLHEYEAFDESGQSVLAVTLLRCTGVISQRVIKTRDEMGGWSEAAPEAQCQGAWSFEYSVIPHEGTWAESRSYVEAHAFNLPMRSLQLKAGQAGQLPATVSRVDLGTPALQVTAFKQCEFEDAMILRFFNTTTEKVDAKVAFNFPFSEIKLANLREDTIGSVDMRGRSACLQVKPFEIVTLKILL